MAGGTILPSQLSGASWPGTEKEASELQALKAKWWRAADSHMPQLPYPLKQVGQDHSIYHLALGPCSANRGGPNPLLLLVLLLCSVGFGVIFRFDCVKCSPLGMTGFSCT